MQNGHGGDIYRNKIELDFSVNTNPYGMPSSVKKALFEAIEDCETYPDITCEALKAALSDYEDIPAEWLLCGNGASELFCAIVHGLRPRKILLPVPSFSGYERAALVEDAQMIFYFLKEEDEFQLTDDFLKELTEEIDLVMLANPNNPVGNTIPTPLVKELADACKKNKTTLVIDECFLPFTKERSFLQEHNLWEYPNVIVVKAFTKTFAIPGVRLGYLAVSDADLREKIEKNLSEWNLSSFAQAAGIAAAKEKTFVEESCPKIRIEQQKLKAELEALGMKVFSSEANFLLIKTELSLYEELLKQQILIRDCSNYHGLQKGFYRIAVRRAEENERLLKAIKKSGGKE